MIKVSVLMPCYNAAGTLERTLESLFAQIYQNYEIVAVDDGSTDDTLAVLRTWARKDKRLQVVSIAHGGIIKALNHGLRLCRGEYIARMDADDLAHPDRLLIQVEYLDRYPEVALVSCLVEGFPKEEIREGFQIYLNWLNNLVDNADIYREMFVESPVAHPSVVYRKDFVLALGGYQEYGWPEDYDLWLRMYLAGARFAKVERVLIYWSDHANRLTRTDSRYSLENFLRAKAHYLVRGPLAGRDAVIVWGAGMMGKRLSKHLLREGATLKAFIDIDPKKIGRTRRGRPVLAPEDLPGYWQRFTNPALLAAVGARGARTLIRERLHKLGLAEGRDWWSVA
jgi:glycosyltransferase involved in cell wall biosynthesis